MSALAAGLDGCRGGWVGVSWERGEARVYATLRDALRALPRPLAVDMPIGLLGDGRTGDRACDREARALLGRPRASSVFPPPTRRALTATVWAPTLGLSKQSYHLLPKIREVDEAMTPARQRRVFESHPELAFARMAGHPMRHAKRTAEGRRERARSLAGIPGDPFATLRRDPRAPGAKPDDVLDACALAWVAWKRARGEAMRVPARPARDARGLAMEIWA